MKQNMKQFGMMIVGAVLLCGAAANAGVIHQPVSATTTMSSWYSGTPTNSLCRENGLLTTYVDGVTNFYTYTQSGLHRFNSPGLLTANAASWAGYLGVLTGNVDFDMGTTHSDISALALWNWGGSDPVNVKNFTLLTDDNASFSSPTTLGSYVASGGGDAFNQPAQVFTFGGTPERYFRMSITSNYGSTQLTAMGEIAFGSVPEPTSMGLLGLGALALLRRRRAR